MFHFLNAVFSVACTAICAIGAVCWAKEAQYSFKDWRKEVNKNKEEQITIKVEKK